MAVNGADQGGRLGAGAHARDDLGVEGDDRRHPEGQRGGQLGFGGAGLRVVRDQQQVQRAARPQMLGTGQLLVDHGLPSRPRAVRPAGQDLDPVGRDAQGAVGAGQGVHRDQLLAASGGEHRLVEAGGGDRRDLREPAERGEVGGGEPVGVGHDVDLCGVGPPQQPGVGAVGAAGPGGRGEYHAADQAEQQRQPGHRPPAHPQVGPQGKPRRSHPQIPPTRCARSARAGSGRPSSRGPRPAARPGRASPG